MVPELKIRSVLNRVTKAAIFCLKQRQGLTHLPTRVSVEYPPPPEEKWLFLSKWLHFLMTVLYLF